MSDPSDEIKDLLKIYKENWKQILFFILVMTLMVIVLFFSIQYLPEIFPTEQQTAGNSDFILIKYLGGVLLGITLFLKAVRKRREDGVLAFIFIYFGSLIAMFAISQGFFDLYQQRSSLTYLYLDETMVFGNWILIFIGLIFYLLLILLTVTMMIVMPGQEEEDDEHTKIFWEGIPEYKRYITILVFFTLLGIPLGLLFYQINNPSILRFDIFEGISLIFYALGSVIGRIELAIDKRLSGLLENK